MSGYDERLLASAPAVTRAEKQEGYHVDILDRDGQRAGSRSQSPAQTAAAAHASNLGHVEAGAATKEFQSLPLEQKPWWRTKKWLTIFVIIAIVCVAAIIGGAVGGSVHKHNNTASSSSSGATSGQIGGGSGGAGGGAQNQSSQSASPSSTSQLAIGGAGPATPTQATPSSTGGGGQGGVGGAAFALVTATAEPAVAGSKDA